MPGGHLAPMRSQEIQVVEKQVETKSIGQGPKMVGCHREKSSWCSEANSEGSKCPGGRGMRLFSFFCERLG